MSLPAGTSVINGFAVTPDGALYVTPTGTASITGGSITGVSGVETIFSKSFIPVFVASSATMGNNGALSAHTALPVVLPGSYVYFPAGAIAAGVPAVADAYYVVWSSPTAGTVFNNRLADNLDAQGAPKAPASNTPFVTTGPGAFTGITTSVAALTLTLPANSLGAYGGLVGNIDYLANNNANNKTAKMDFGSSTVFNENFSSAAAQRQTVDLGNAGATNAQVMFTGTPLGIGFAGITDTTQAVSIVLTITHGTAATDYIAIASFVLKIVK